MTSGMRTRRTTTATRRGGRPGKDVPAHVQGHPARIPIMDVQPVIGGGHYSAKACVGVPFEVTALVFREGHDRLGADVVATDPTGVRRPPVRMHDVSGDVSRMAASFVPDAVGAWTFELQSWSDPLATWIRDATIKVRAGVDVDLMFAEGVLLLERWLRDVEADAGARAVMSEARATLADTTAPPAVRLSVIESSELAAAAHAWPLRDLMTTSPAYPLFADRTRALFTSWYEFFVRSEGAVENPDGSITNGNLRTAAARLPAVAAMGFDVLYLPPIHPIGEVNRKGPNNTLEAGPHDVGSPWAIGSRHGGHDAVHPDLGTLDDFDDFVATARGLGIEVALDFALQAAPDHPWVDAHPEWFTTRADGSIAYAENPPKKYQDIYPINFDNDYEGITAEAERVLRHWMDHGVRIFRVDNPHTKPVAFWADLLGRIRATDPDVLFLAEAFTTPPMMRALATVGFHQSYTYFTWRNTRDEIESYLTEVSRQTSSVLRPSFWVNTPDILPTYLQGSGPAGFKIRAALAATASPSWGVYAGYELCEHAALRPGGEEYLDSEKYQTRIRDWKGAEVDGRSLAPYLTRLNDIRRAHPALQQLDNLTVHRTDDEAMLCFSKQSSAGDTVIVVLNLDPHHARETVVRLDLPALGMDRDASFEVTDLLIGDGWTWAETNYVRLDPSQEPAHILAVRHGNEDPT